MGVIISLKKGNASNTAVAVSGFRLVYKQKSSSSHLLTDVKMAGELNCIYKNLNVILSTRTIDRGGDKYEAEFGI